MLDNFLRNAVSLLMHLSELKLKLLQQGFLHLDSSIGVFESLGKLRRCLILGSAVCHGTLDHLLCILHGCCLGALDEDCLGFLSDCHVVSLGQAGIENLLSLADCLLLDSSNLVWGVGL